MKIDGRKIGKEEPPYIIAELSANHNGSLARALDTIEAAKACGADAVKIQTYTPDTMTIQCDKPDFKIKGGLWDGYSLYELYQWAHTPYEWHEAIYDHARKIGITLFSSPFDETAVDLLESLDTPAYKIASFEMVDIPLLRLVAQKKRPIIMSTGMAQIGEIEDAVSAVKEVEDVDLILLHCISSYPAPTEQSRLRMIRQLSRHFGLAVGLSDHTMDNTAAIASIALGACVIEKHFILDRNLGGPDSQFSLEPDEFKHLVEQVKKIWRALGDSTFSRAEEEGGSVVFRRSIYFVKDLKAGHIIKADDIRRIRPGMGLAPRHFGSLVGRVLANNVERGDPVTWDALVN